MERSILYSLAILVVFPVISASSCQTRAVMSRIRNVHADVRQAFVMTDEFVAPRFEEAGDRCLEETSSAEEADECMRVWIQLDDTLSVSREALAELENVYNSIESGVEGGESEWQRWALQLLSHGRSIVRLLFEVDGSNEVVAELRRVLDLICEVANCEGS